MARYSLVIWASAIMFPHHRPSQTHVPMEAAVALQKVRRLRAKGEVRRMLTVLGQACAMLEDDARLWALYGALLATHGRMDDGRRALRRALFLRHAAHDLPRERSTRAYLERIEGAAA